MMERLEYFRKEPFQPDRAAVALKPGLVALAGHKVDPIRLGLGRVMFPQFWPSEWRAAKFFKETQRRAIGHARQHGATCEIHPDAHNLLPRHGRQCHRLLASHPHAVEPITRMLQRIIVRQP